MGAGAGEHHVLCHSLSGATLSLGRGQRKRNEKREEERGEQGSGVRVSLRSCQAGFVSMAAALGAHPSTEGKRATKFAAQAEETSKHNTICYFLAQSASILLCSNLLYSPTVQRLHSLLSLLSTQA